MIGMAWWMKIGGSESITKLVEGISNFEIIILIVHYLTMKIW